MYQKGDLIIYGSTGVCLVEDVKAPGAVPSADKTKQYYKLTPVYSKETIYVPTDTAVFMRPIISRAEVEDLISKIPDIEGSAFDCRNLKMLSDHYQTILQTHKCEDLIQLIKSVHAKNETMLQCGKRLGQTDQRFMKRAEDLLYGEFASALDIPRENVRDYIQQSVEAQLA